MSNISRAIYQAAVGDLTRLSEFTARSHRVEAADDDVQEGWRHQQTWRFADGETVTNDATSKDQLIVPATTGYELLWFELPDEGEPPTYDIAKHTKRVPIVGWHLIEDSENENRVEPITTERLQGANWFKSFKSVAFPDGRVAWHSPWHVPPINHGSGPICKSFDEWVGLVRQVWPAVIKHEDDKRRQREEAAKPCPHCGRDSAQFDDELLF